MATTTYTPIYSTTLSSNQSTVSFSSFGGYTDLRIVANIKLTGTNGLYFKPNSDSSSSYSATTMYGNGSSATSSRLTTGDLGGTGMYIPGGTFSTSTFSVLQLDFMNYTNTNVYKTVLARYSTSDARVGTSVELYAKTNAITTLEFGCDGGGSIASGSTFTLYGIANADSGAKATGGIITYDDTYFYHTFGASGTFTPQQNLTNVDYLVIAGGGGGGRYYGGGGGAGGLRSTVDVTGGGGTLESKISLTSNTAYTITVGAGGAGGIDSGSGAQAGTNGVNSSIAGSGLTTITSTGGGGGGGAYGGSNNPGLTGGSGGGGNRDASTAGGSGTANQGYAGSTYTSGTGINAGGGGGGAGEAGNTDGNAQGGDGVAIPTIANVTGTGVATYYAGGGGGGAEFVSIGGLGGGGNGGVNSTIASPGVVNTGGGGGGGSQAPSYVGGAGGSGLVVIRYAKA